MGLLDDELDQTELLEYTSVMKRALRSCGDVTVADIPRQIGFDKVVLGMHLKEIKWEQFDDVLNRESETGSHTLYVSAASDMESALTICMDRDPEKRYKSITVRIRNCLLSIHTNNGKDIGDSCRFVVCIPPMKDHSILGNFHNLTCQQEQEWVQELIQRISEYGIYLDQNYAKIREAELNINLLFESVDSYVNFTEFFRAAICSIDDFHFDISDFYAPDTHDGFLLDNENDIFVSTDIPALKKNALRAVSPTREILLYDKADETIAKSNKTNKTNKTNKKLSWIAPVLRIEVRIKDPKEARVYFRKENLFSLEQDDVERAFHKFAKKHFRKNVIAYRQKMMKALETQFSQIDIHAYGWRHRTIAAIANAALMQNGTVFLSRDEVIHLVKCIHAKSVSKNAGRIADSLILKINSLSIPSLKIVDIEKYLDLVDWLCSVHGAQHQYVFYSLSSR